MKTVRLTILLILAASCSATNKSFTEAKALERMRSLDHESQQHINALISMIEEQSLLTDSGATRWVPYEFRIPLDSLKRNEIQKIDPLVKFTNRTDSFQCIGENATKEKVFQIVALPYTYKIKFCPFE
jgi:hypothetical protein